MIYPPPDKLPKLASGGWTQALCADGVTKEYRDLRQIPYTFGDTFTPVMRAGAKIAMDAWSKASGGKITFQQSKPNKPFDPYVKDAYGILFRSLNGWIGPTATALAITVPNDTPDNRLTTAVIIVNTNLYSWHQGDPYYTWPVAAKPRVAAKKASADINLVILHELGHALGFGHSGQPDSIMFPYLHPRTGLSGLSADDLVGLSTVYP